MSVCDRPCRRAAARLAAPPGTGRAGCRLLRAAVCPGDRGHCRVRNTTPRRRPGRRSQDLTRIPGSCVSS
jgi:hypothetical protein